MQACSFDWLNMWFIGVPEKPPTTIISINKYIYIYIYIFVSTLVVLVSSGIESIG
jgi:hypothetical protein